MMTIVSNTKFLFSSITTQRNSQRDHGIQKGGKWIGHCFVRVQVAWHRIKFLRFEKVFKSILTLVFIETNIWRGSNSSTLSYFCPTGKSIENEVIMIINCTWPYTHPWTAASDFYDLHITLNRKSFLVDDNRVIPVMQLILHCPLCIQR